MRLEILRQSTQQALRECILLAQYAAANGSPAPAEIKASIQSFVTGIVSKSTYTASKVAEGAIGTIDVNDNNELSYASYKIVGNKLYLSDTCTASDIDPDSDDNCKLLGETAAHRSTDFAGGLIFTK